MLAKKKKTKNNYIQMNEQIEADKSSGFVHPRVEHAFKSSAENQAKPKPPPPKSLH